MSNVLYLAEGGIQRELITYAVRRVGFSEFLYRREMDHVVAGLIGHTEPILPLVERPQCFGQDRLTADTVHRDTVIHLSGMDNWIHEEIAGTVRLFH